MIYAIDGITDTHGMRVLRYIMFESYTGTTFGIGMSEIKTMIENGIKIANLELENGRVIEKKWPHEINRSTMQNCRCHEGRYIYLRRVGADKYKIIESNGDIEYADISTFKQYIDYGMVINCDVTKVNGEKYYSCIGNEDLTQPEGFENSIRKEYNEFKSKCRVLGIDSEFNICVAGKEVILTRYSGRAVDVIMPKFITIIDDKVFAYAHIRSIKLNEGLKIIGKNAFNSSELDSIEIPNSVQLIMQGAFSYVKLKYNKTGYKQLNPKTVKLIDED